MSTNLWLLSFLFGAAVITLGMPLGVGAQQQDTAEIHIYNFPNPQVNLSRCRMEAPSYLCDPEEVIKKQGERDMIAKHLAMLEEETKSTNTSDPCRGIGLRLGVVLRQGEITMWGNPQQSVSQVIAEKWNFDQGCKKAALMVFDKVNTKWDTFAYNRFYLTKAELDQLLDLEHHTFKSGRIMDGLLGVVSSVKTVSVARATLWGIRVDPNAGKEAILGPRNLGIILGMILGCLVLSLLLLYRFCIRPLKGGNQKRGKVMVTPGHVHYNQNSPKMEPMFGAAHNNGGMGVVQQHDRAVLIDQTPRGTSTERHSQSIVGSSVSKTTSTSYTIPAVPNQTTTVVGNTFGQS